MADLNKLAILTNELAGIDEVSELLDVDESLLQYALEGGELTFNEDAEINQALSAFIRDTDAQKDYSLDISDLFGINEFGYATGKGLDNVLDDVNRAIDDADDIIKWRYAVADGKVDLDDLDRAGLFFKQGNITPKVIDRIVGWTFDNAHNAKEFLDLFELDGFDLRNIQDSYFWEWYRETMY